MFGDSSSHHHRHPRKRHHIFSISSAVVVSLASSQDASYSPFPIAVMLFSRLVRCLCIISAVADVFFASAGTSLKPVSPFRHSEHNDRLSDSTTVPASSSAADSFILPTRMAHMSTAVDVVSRIARGGAVAKRAKGGDTKKLTHGSHAMLALRELAESAAYGFVYALFAVLFAGWVERLFPKYKATGHAYTVLGLLLQVCAQAGVNCAMAQFTRRIVSRLPLLDQIDGQSDKKLPAAGGGVIFSFLMFTRQSNWKAKVQALDALLDKTKLFQ